MVYLRKQKAITRYVELGVTSNFSFLQGASHPEELVETAAKLGYQAIAISDRNTVAGIVRFHVAAKSFGIQAIIGSRIDLEDGASIICLPTNRSAYGRLVRLLTVGKRRAGKAGCQLWRADIESLGLDQILIVLPPFSLDITLSLQLDQNANREFRTDLLKWAEVFPGCVYLSASMFYHGNDESRLAVLDNLGREVGIPLIATNDVLYNIPERRPLQDILTCIYNRCTIAEAGFKLQVNAERYLKSPSDMARLFRNYPSAIAKTLEIAERCQFSLDDLCYEYPEIVVVPNRTVQQELELKTWQGAENRYPLKDYPKGVPDKVQVQLRHELSLIEKLNYAPYFLTVFDLVCFARNRGILCQGRGSAANSAVCYCLGITAVDPSCSDLLFERFISEERGEPPDIDIDFEHERREEIIQHIYQRYGRSHAGLAATVVTFRARSAVREVGKVMGLSADVIGVLASQIWSWCENGIIEEQMRQIGLDPNDRTLRLVINLARQLIGFPRHLSQHVGGFVITRGRLDELVPIENATMAGRTVIEWDKDDLDSLGILKVDILALGMLSCLRKGFDLIKRHYGVAFDLASVPSEDSAVYDMLCKGDSLGVFQVESRAQMAMLPRIRPRSFYDLVIEVAIVRPGPIQGNMVHPYLRRRNGDEVVNFPSKELRGVLEKTLGIPLFQEQAMKIAIIAAGFTPSEADQLRRAMATFRKTDKIRLFEYKMIEGMVDRGYERSFAERCFKQIEGFGNYGFPESHAASFALLVYVSSWMKCHMPAAFAGALLNSQPMGFYAPAQIVRDAREHGVEILPPDVNRIGWDCDLEGDSRNNLKLRLGLRQIKGLRKEDAIRIDFYRSGDYLNPQELMRRTGISLTAMQVLAHGDAFGSMGLSRRQAFWAIRGLMNTFSGSIKSSYKELPLFLSAENHLGESLMNHEPIVSLPLAQIGEEVVDDYSSLRLSLKAHPLSLLRSSLVVDGYQLSSDLDNSYNHQKIKLSGLVLVRQRPSTAKGIIFITIEDEVGTVNLVVWPDKFEKFRHIIMNAKLIGATGRIQREGRVIHVVIEKLKDLSCELLKLTNVSFDDSYLKDVIASADEVIHPDRQLSKSSKTEIKKSSKKPLELAKTKMLRTHPRNMRINLRIKSRDFH